MVEKRTIFLELPCEMIEKIDTWNNVGDRSLFVTELLEKQLQNENSKTDIAEMETKMNAFEKSSAANISTRSISIRCQRRHIGG